MIFTEYLRKTIFISLLGHLTVFSIFSLSFGPKIPEANFANISFWGTILRNADFKTVDFNKAYRTGAALRAQEVLILDKVSRQAQLVSRDYLKPAVGLSFGINKINFVRKSANPPVLKRKEPAIMFYPRLPYYFTLFFKDRQVAHIELMFSIIPSGKRNFVTVKRKISSGNLEADLLSMRYISRYLFIQQMEFTPNNWQTVKIDLSKVND